MPYQLVPNPTRLATNAHPMGALHFCRRCGVIDRNETDNFKPGPGDRIFCTRCSQWNEVEIFLGCLTCRKELCEETAKKMVDQMFDAMQNPRAERREKDLEEARALRIDGIQHLGNDNALIVLKKHTCECDMSSRFPGIEFPFAHDGDFDFAFVARCDMCLTFDSDLEAALFVSRILNREVAFLERRNKSPIPYIKGLTFNQAIPYGRKATNR